MTASSRPVLGAGEGVKQDVLTFLDHIRWSRNVPVDLRCEAGALYQALMGAGGPDRPRVPPT